MPDDSQADRTQQPSRPSTGFGDRISSPPATEKVITPRAPELPPGLRSAERERTLTLRFREALERKSMLRGLIVLALVILVVSLIRAGADRAFPVGWWRRW